jgi:hypothetical protein
MKLLEANKSSAADEPENREKANWMQVREVREAVTACSRAHVSLYLRIDYKYNYKKIKEKDNINIILIIINISRRSSLEEVNHVKIIGQKHGSNRALGNFDGSPNLRTQPKDP